MALGLDDKKYIKVIKGGTTYNLIAVNVVKGGVTYNVWGASSAVTYVVDSSKSYSEDVVRGNSVLSPTTFTPSKDGYTFVGWREDKTASSTVLTSKTMGDSPMTLYAVFKRTLTLTYYDNTTTKATKSGTQYYNNGNTNNPSWAMTQADKSGWTKRGWATATTGNASISYSNGASISIGSNTTIYGCYSKTLTLTYYDGSTTAQTKTGTQYYNSAGNTTNPSQTMTQTAKSGWNVRGWSTSTTGNASVTYNDKASITFSSNLTIYGLYQQTITLTYYNNSTTAKTSQGTRYWNSAGNYTNPTFTLSQADKSGWDKRGWATGTAGNASVAYSSISNTSFSSNTTVYGLYSKSLTLTYYNNSTTAATKSGTAYYNSAGNTVNPSQTMSQADKSGWDKRGWATSNTADASISYNNGASITFSSNLTIYGCYSQTITLTYYNNSTTAKTSTGTRYYNSGGNTKNPTFTLSQADKSGWTKRGWSTSTGGNASVTYSSISSTAFSSNTTVYGLYYKTCTLTAISYNKSEPVSGTAYYNSSGDTYNVSWTAPTGASCSGWTWRGWATGTGASTSIAYANGATIWNGTSDLTIYGCYQQTITLSYNGNGNTGGSTASQTGTRYWNAADNTSNPSFTLANNGYTKTENKFSKWAQGSASGTQYAAGASVTLSANTTFYAVWTSVPTKSFSYTGGMQSYTAPVAGTYKLEVWGAQGCSNVNGTLNEGGLGGYSYGNVTLSANQTIYICVGQYKTQYEEATYNGGGASGGYAGAGGGATHIAKTNRGVLKNYASYTSEVLIVAGGGGGSAHNNEYADWMYGGTGGGTNGGGGRLGGGASQTAGGNLGSANMKYAGSFGQGGSAASDRENGGYSGCGGGGGGWYGGSAGLVHAEQRAGGGGGSGYIGGVTGGATQNGKNSGSGKATISFVA